VVALVALVVLVTIVLRCDAGQPKDPGGAAEVVAR
jgi:hypothetical protein